jgi:aerobic-type carbon monoxide dehydrogenase small subunit (CoxS/CutS family)
MGHQGTTSVGDPPKPHPQAAKRSVSALPVIIAPWLLLEADQCSFAAAGGMITARLLLPRQQQRSDDQASSNHERAMIIDRDSDAARIMYEPGFGPAARRA